MIREPSTPDEERRYRLSCLGKRSYGSRHEAHASIQQRLRYTSLRHKLEVYSCKFCGGIHVGNSMGAKRNT